MTIDYKNPETAPALLLCLLLLLTGCSHWQTVAQREALQQQVVQGQPFRHRLFWNHATQAMLQQHPATPVLWHLYIEGDGQAVDAFGRVSADPTPNVPLLLPVLGADHTPALYLGRPCYYQTADPLCHPRHWTLERYSQHTLDSLLAAATRFLPPQDRVILIGHSGGGTLAMLLAAQWPQVCGLITLAGNLDVNAWIQANQYSPLPDSLDPAHLPPLRPDLAQWHFAGQQDNIIRPDWIATVSAHQPGAHFMVLEQQDHQHHWQQHLRNSLQAMQSSMPIPANKAPLLSALHHTHQVCGKVTLDSGHKGL